MIKDVRILLTVSNLEHMRSNVMRKLIDLFEAAYHVKMEEDLRVSIALNSSFTPKKYSYLY
jgi:exocyst complex component 2